MLFVLACCDRCVSKHGAREEAGAFYDPTKGVFNCRYLHVVVVIAAADGVCTLWKLRVDSMLTAQYAYTYLHNFFNIENAFIFPIWVRFRVSFAAHHVERYRIKPSYNDGRKCRRYIERLLMIVIWICEYS